MSVSIALLCQINDELACMHDVSTQNIITVRFLAIEH